LGRLVYLEAYKNITDAISREKKIVLIETENPN
jgi:predicted GIY-YIG superfamily endonuclease